jgi:transforming growth factor-beta-induced protein
MKAPITLRTLLVFLLAPALSLMLFTACGDDNGGVTDPGNGNGDTDQNIVETAQDDDNFSILVELAIEADLVDVLANEELTLFAPTNAAFERLFEDVDRDALTQDDLVDILTYHATEGTTLSSEFIAGDNAVTMENDEQTLVQASAGGVLINGYSNVTEADINASNGVIHAVDEVLLPRAFREPSIVEVAMADEEGRFSTLASLVEGASGGGVELLLRLQFLPGYTAFAPTNEAFEALDVNVEDLPEEAVVGILTYHVTQGEAPIMSDQLEEAQEVPTLANAEPVYVTVTDEGVFVNRTAEVIEADIVGANGVIHAIDEVLLPNPLLPVTGVISKNYNLLNLLGVLNDYPELLATLSDEGEEYTVFAPNNEAIAEVQEDLGFMSDEEIEQILLYHVVPGRILAEDLEDGQSAETAQGSTIEVTIDGETVEINQATVVTADLEGSNGVVHIIDSVLMPPSDE